MKPLLKQPPRREEWYFEDVPESERWACYFYEYSRSHDTMPTNIAKMRNASPEAKRRINNFYAMHFQFWFKEGSVHKESEIFGDIARISPEFPETPWQAILPEVRKIRVRDLLNVERDIYRPVQVNELSKFVQDLMEKTG